MLDNVAGNFDAVRKLAVLETHNFEVPLGDFVFVPWLLVFTSKTISELLSVRCSYNKLHRWNIFFLILSTLHCADSALLVEKCFSCWEIKQLQMKAGMT